MLRSKEIHLPIVPFYWVVILFYYYLCLLSPSQANSLQTVRQAGTKKLREDEKEKLENSHWIVGIISLNLSKAQRLGDKNLK